MKKYITFFGIITIFFAGMQLATAQEQTQEQLKAQQEYALKKREMGKAKANKQSTEELAEQRTVQLTTVVKLDKKQAVRVYEVFLIIEKKRAGLATVSDERKRNSETKVLENVEREKLKEILSEDQFTRYMDSVKTEKR